MLWLTKWVALIILFTSSSQCVLYITISNLSSVLALCALWSGGDSYVLLEASFRDATVFLHKITTEMSDFHSTDYCKIKALEQQWISETKVKTWSLCAHDNPLMHAQADIILNSFSFISIFLCICCQLHHQKASVPVSSLPWMADHPSVADEQTHEGIQLERARNTVCLNGWRGVINVWEIQYVLEQKSTILLQRVEINV